jgi:hypothetical protein
MQCDRCRKRAVIHQPYSGLHLCNEHFIADFEAKAKRAIRTHGGLSRNDHIAVALTGRGADCALLQFLSRLTGRRRDIILSGIVAGDGAFLGHDIRAARACAASLGIGCISASFEEEPGISPQDPVLAHRGGDTSHEALWQLLLHRAARRHQVTKLAFCSSLDDEAEEVLAQVLNGTPDRLLRMSSEIAGQVPVIRPFMYAPFAEVALYARLTTGVAAGEGYPVPADAFAADVRDFVRDYSLRHPSTPYALVSLGEQLTGAGMRLTGDCQPCERGDGEHDTDRRIPEEVAYHGR